MAIHDGSGNNMSESDEESSKLLSLSSENGEGEGIVEMGEGGVVLRAGNGDRLDGGGAPGIAKAEPSAKIGLGDGRGSTSISFFLR